MLETTKSNRISKFRIKNFRNDSLVREFYAFISKYNLRKEALNKIQDKLVKKTGTKVTKH
jgi:predicted DNA-binding protein (UPF0278 family)